jgi:endoglucanase
MGLCPDGQPYAQCASKFLNWGAFDRPFAYYEINAVDSLFATDPAVKQRDLDVVSQGADWLLGENALGLSMVTGMGTDQLSSPLHLDSYYTKYGASDGITSEHLGHPIGNVPGLVVYGPTEGRANVYFQFAATNKSWPVWDSLPVLRRYTRPWNAVANNEFTIHETQGWVYAMYGVLYNASADPNAVMTPGDLPAVNPPPNPCSSASPLVQYQQRSYQCSGGSWTPGPWQPVVPTCTLTVSVPDAGGPDGN